MKVRERERGSPFRIQFFLEFLWKERERKAREWGKGEERKQEGKERGRERES